MHRDMHSLKIFISSKYKNLDIFKVFYKLLLMSLIYCLGLKIDV